MTCDSVILSVIIHAAGPMTANHRQAEVKPVGVDPSG